MGVIDGVEAGAGCANHFDFWPETDPKPKWFARSLGSRAESQPKRSCLAARTS
jgi:hypothetical protein